MNNGPFPELLFAASAVAIGIFAYNKCTKKTFPIEKSYPTPTPKMLEDVLTLPNGTIKKIFQSGHSVRFALNPSASKSIFSGIEKLAVGKWKLEDLNAKQPYFFNQWDTRLTVNVNKKTHYFELPATHVSTTELASYLAGKHFMHFFPNWKKFIESKEVFPHITQVTHHGETSIILNGSFIAPSTRNTLENFLEKHFKNWTESELLAGNPDAEKGIWANPCIVIPSTNKFNEVVNNLHQNQLVSHSKPVSLNRIG